MKLLLLFFIGMLGFANPGFAKNDSNDSIDLGRDYAQLDMLGGPERLKNDLNANLEPGQKEFTDADIAKIKKIRLANAGSCPTVGQVERDKQLAALIRSCLANGGKTGSGGIVPILLGPSAGGTRQ